MLPEDRAGYADEVQELFDQLAAKDVTVRGTYDVSGLRADADVMIWWHAETADQLQEAYNLFRRTRLGRALEPVWSNMALHRPAEFNRSHIPAFLADETPRDYVSVYPFVRSYDWYLLPDEDRRRMLADHGKMARGYPDVRANTVASFSLGDYEWILAFEADELYRIVDLMRHLRASEARMHVREEVPFYTGRRKDGRRAGRGPRLTVPAGGRRGPSRRCGGRRRRERRAQLTAPQPGVRSASARRPSRLRLRVRRARRAPPREPALQQVRVQVAVDAAGWGRPRCRACPASRSVTSTEPDSRRCSSRAPAYGVAASRSAARISVGGSSPGPRSARRAAAAGAPASTRTAGSSTRCPRSRTGATRASRVLSRSQTCQSVGQGASLHSTAV